MEPTTVKSFKLRGTRITAAQLSARDRLWSTFGINASMDVLDLLSLFPSAQRIIMEIGFGMGEATALIAKHFPEDGFLAVEVHQPGIGKLLSRIEEAPLSNVKVIDSDVHIVLHDNIADSSLDGIHLFFPDPWPKARHHKRRIITPAFLELIYQKLKPAGIIYIATDWVPYAESIEETFASSPLFHGGKADRPEWRPLTRFEGQGITKDHSVNDFKYVKN